MRQKRLVTASNEAASNGKFEIVSQAGFVLVYVDTGGPAGKGYAERHTSAKVPAGGSVDLGELRLRRHRLTPGDVRGSDVRTGKKLWTFRAVPGPGELGSELPPVEATGTPTTTEGVQRSPSPLEHSNSPRGPRPAPGWCPAMAFGTHRIKRLYTPRLK